MILVKYQRMLPKMSLLKQIVSSGDARKIYRASLIIGCHVYKGANRRFTCALSAMLPKGNQALATEYKPLIEKPLSGSGSLRFLLRLQTLKAIFVHPV